MKNNTRLFRRSLAASMFLSAAIFLAGCESTKTTCAQKPGPAVAPSSAPVPAPAASVAVSFPLRIKAGTTTPVKDAEGNLWLPEQGFADGDTIDRGEDLQIENTKSPSLYRSEHYGMTAFSCKVPNGKYTVKLHFCETFEEITSAGQRVFSFAVGGREFKDFDVFVKAGGARKAYVETVSVDVADGKLDIKFTSNVENPEINAIEIIPAN